MKRREFLRHSMMAAGALSLGGAQALAEKPASALRLTLLHTNDVHSHLDPMPGGEFAGLGGASQRLAMINRLRAKHRNVLLLDAGDMFQGTQYFNLFKGEADVRAMSAAGYDAGTIGNHEFDAGIERLAEVTREHTNFPLLNCNYDFRNTPMKGHTREHLVIEKEGLRIGLLGVGIKLDGLVFPGYYGETIYRDPIADADRVAKHLRNEENCDFIICLSHINLFRRRDASDEPGDRDLIAEVPEIDVVIGGHNHLMIEPEAFWRRGGTGYVTQAGWGGTHLGFLQFDVYGREKKELAAASIPAVSAHA